MPPKKKGRKGGNDDWEAELGESIAPVAPAAPDGANADADKPEEEEAPAGGLMATLRKNREKRKKKGIQDDFVEGEDPPGAEPQAAEEANMEDEWVLPERKGRGTRGPVVSATADDKPQSPNGAPEAPRVLTKAEKEKLKKEKEKQRKKELVSTLHHSPAASLNISLVCSKCSRQLIVSCVDM